MRTIVFFLASVLAALSSLGGAQSGQTQTVPTFEDVSEEWGLNHSYGGGGGGGDWYVVGGGVAVFDCDQDGTAEALLSGGENPLSFLKNQAGQGFTDLTATLGLDDESVLRVTGAYPFDYDADGHVDLFIMRFGQNVLLKGLGNCAFDDVTTQLLPARSDWTTAFAALRSEDASFRKWVVGNYVARDRALSKMGNCDASYFLTLDGTNMVLTPFPEGSSHCALSLAFIDLNGDQVPELRVANDRAYYAPHGTEQIFTADASGEYKEVAAEAWAAPQLWGMGLASTTLADGRLAVSVTNMAENHLQVLDLGAFAFENQAFARGVASQQPYAGEDLRPSTAWHNQFADFNGDGQDDLLIIKGNVDSMPQFASYDPDSLLLARGDGTWVEAGDRAGIATGNRGRGAGIADFNGDGCLDFIVVNRNEQASIYLQTHCSTPVPFTNTRHVGGGHAGGGWFE